MPEEPVAGPDTSSQTPTDPYVIYQLRKPSQRGTAVIPRFVPNTHAPAFSPANYRFARVWATSDSSAAQSALLQIPRSFEYAGSIGSESSIWSDTSSWVSVSSLRTAPSEVRTPLLHQPPAPSASSFFQNDPDKLRNSLRASSARSSAPSSDMESPKRPSFRYPPALSESVSEDAIVDDLLSRPSDLPHHSSRSPNHPNNLPSSTRIPSDSPLKDVPSAKSAEESLQDSPSIRRISDRHRDHQPRESNPSRPFKPDRSRQPANRSSFLPALTRKRRSLWQWLFCSDAHAHSSVASARLPPCTVERPRDQPLTKPSRPSKNDRMSKADRDVTGLSHPKPDPRASTRRRRSPSFEIRRGKPAQTEQSRRSLSWSLVPRAILGLGNTPEKARNSKERRRKSVSAKPGQRGSAPSPDIPNSTRVSYQKQNQTTRQDHHESNGSRQQSGHGHSERIRSTSSKGRSRESSKDERIRHDQKVPTSRGTVDRHRENGREKARENREGHRTGRLPTDRPRDSRTSPSADPRGSGAQKAPTSSTRMREASQRTQASAAKASRVGSDMSSRSHPRSSSHSGVSARDERKMSINGSDKTVPTARQLSNASSNKSSKPGYRTPSNTSQKLSSDGRHYKTPPSHNTHSSNAETQVGTLALAEGMLNGLFPQESRGDNAVNGTASGVRQPILTVGDTGRTHIQSSPQLPETSGRLRAASPSTPAKLFAFPSSSSEGSTGQGAGKLKTNVWEEPPVVVTNGMTDHPYVNGTAPTHMGPKGALGTDTKRRTARMPEAVARAMEKNRARSNGGPLSYLTKHHETEADTNTGSTGLTSLADESVSTHKTVSVTGEEYMYVEDPIRSGRRRAVRENGPMDCRVDIGGSTTPSIFQSSALFDRSRSPISGGGGASPRRFHSDWSDPHATDIDVYCQCNCSCVYEEECRRSCDLIYGRSPSVSSTKSCGRKALSNGVKAPGCVVDDAMKKWNSRGEGGAAAAAALLGGANVPAASSGSGHQTRSGTPGKPQKTMMRATTVDELPDVDSGRRLVSRTGHQEELTADGNFVGGVDSKDVKVGKQRVRVSSGYSDERPRSPYVDSGRLSREVVNGDGKNSMEARVAAATVAALERRREHNNGRSNGMRGSGNRGSNGAKNESGQSRDSRRRTSGTHGDGTNGRSRGTGTGYEHTASRANGYGDAPQESYLASRDLVRTFSNDGMIEKKDVYVGRNGGRSGSTTVKAGKDERNGQTRGMRRSGRTGARQRAPLFGIF